MAMASKDLLKGRELKWAELDDPVELSKIAVASVLQSGFGGIAGDYIFNDYRQYSTSLADVAAGPTGSVANDVFEFIQAGRDVIFSDEEAIDAAAAGWRAVKGNIPYANHWATRTLFDYLINYQVQEILNPGSLRRMERRFRQKNNQDYNSYFFDIDMTPSSVVAPGGGFR
jgi:hypothetical protein